MDSVEIFLFSTALLLVLCVLLSKASGKIGIPSLVVFLAVGVMAGSEGIGGIYFDNAYYAKTLGIVALAYILFSGGLDTKWSSIKPALRPSFSLATLGVLVTTLVVGLFLHYLFSFTLIEGLLTGAIVSSTDAGAIFTVLRSKSINLKNNITPVLELESGSNDPMAIFLVTTFLGLMDGDGVQSYWILIPKLFRQMIVGGAIGWAWGRGLSYFMNKLKLEFEGLYIVFSLASVLLIYTSSQALQGNGFLSVYIAGVILGNHAFIYKKTIRLFHDGVSWLMQSSMFLTLGLLIFPSRVINISADGFIVAAFMILIARPISVFISLANSRYDYREKLLISWVGLRGAVPIIMATYPLVAGIAKADYIFNLVFFVSVTSLLIQGTTVSFVARLLGLLENVQKIDDQYSNLNLKNNLNYHFIAESSSWLGKSIVDLKLPEKFLVVLIERNNEIIIPRGATQFELKDKVMIVADRDTFKEGVK